MPPIIGFVRNFRVEEMLFSLVIVFVLLTEFFANYLGIDNVTINFHIVVAPNIEFIERLSEAIDNIPMNLSFGTFQIANISNY